MQTSDTTPTFEWIAPAIRHLSIPIDSVLPDPSNAKVHSERNLEVIRGSLRRFKQQTPIVLDANRVIRKGNGTYEAAKLEGWTHIAAVVSDLAGAEATSYAVADNRSGSPEVGSTWDNETLATTLESLKAENADAMLATGFTLEEVAKLVEQTKPIAADFQPAGIDDQSRLDQKKAITCPHCGKEFTPE